MAKPISPSSPRRPHLRHGLGCALCACATVVAASARADDWPSVALPNGVTPFEIGRQITLNGLPMQLRGFVSGLDASASTEGFRRSLGQPLVENTIGNKRVLGRVLGEYYLSVQIEAAGRCSRGVVAVTHLKAAYDNRAATQADTQHWLARLPAGSRLTSRMESQDAGKVSRHMVIVNSQDEALNRDRLVSLLTGEGLTLERDSSVDTRVAHRMPDGVTGGRMLFFKGPNKDATATVSRDDAGRTTVVLNVVTTLERLP